MSLPNGTAEVLIFLQSRRQGINRNMSEPASAPLKISCAIIVDDESRTLLVRKANTDFYMQPEGKIETGESSLDCLKRELMEELGASFDEAQMEFVGQYSEVAANERNRLLHADIYFIRHTFQPSISSEIVDYIWLDAVREERHDLAPLTKNIVLGLVRKYCSEAGR
jgi:8-oxo-dGTP pyrophosphatase MutT (NUDIX family)